LGYPPVAQATRLPAYPWTPDRLTATRTFIPAGPGGAEPLSFFCRSDNCYNYFGFRPQGRTPGDLPPGEEAGPDLPRDRPL